MKYGFIQAHRHTWSVQTMCRVLKVSRSGFYDWLAREPSDRQRANEQLSQRIGECFVASRGTYGSPRMTRELRAQGYLCSVNRVARLMRRASLQGRQRRRYVNKSCTPTGRDAIAPNLLDRAFTVMEPNTKWVADITYAWTSEGWLYLAAIMDLYSRKIIGWSMQPSMSSQLIIDAAKMAYASRGHPREVLHHSDQGTQYTSKEFLQFLKSQETLCSMSRRGNCWDNAVMESFFSTLKLECLYRSKFKTRAELRMVIFDYIECFYNRHRRHSANGYLSPCDFEAQIVEKRAVSE